MSLKIKKSTPLYNKLKVIIKRIKRYNKEILRLEKDINPFSGPLNNIKLNEEIAEINKKIDADKKHYDKLIYDNPEYFI